MKPDAELMLAVQRNQTGAEIHKLNNLLHQYMCESQARRPRQTQADRGGN
jgi:hypothetical protein